MKKIIYLGLGLSLSLFSYSSVQAQAKDTSKTKVVKKENSNELLYYTETMPQYPGGNDAMKKFIRENLKYPQEALDKKVKGAVFVEVNVEKDGSLSDISVVFGIGSGCNEEAIRIAKAMPKWKPGLKNGMPARVLMRFPVMFELPGEKSMYQNQGDMKKK